MAVANFSDLRKHVGHKIVCVGYKDWQIESHAKEVPSNYYQNVAVECETCNEVLLDYDRE